MTGAALLVSIAALLVLAYLRAGERDLRDAEDALRAYAARCRAYHAGAARKPRPAPSRSLPARSRRSRT